MVFQKKGSEVGNETEPIIVRLYVYIHVCPETT